MAQDKQFRVSVDDSKIRSLETSAKTLAQEMIRSSRQYSTSSKEVLKDIEDQIRAIEKRNKLDDQFSRQRIEAGFQSGRLDSGQRQAQINTVDQGSNEDKLQVQLLRGVIEAINASSKNEIREDRIGVERRVRESNRVESLNPEGDAEDILRETIQYGLIGEVTEGERDQRTRFRDRSKQYGEGANRGLGMAAGSKNEFFLAASALALIPVIGQGLSQLTNRVIGSATNYEKSLSGIAAFYGTNMGMSQAFLPSKGSAGALGLSRGDYGQRMLSLEEAAGGRLGSEETYNILSAERGFGLGQGMSQQLAGVARYGKNFTSAGGNKLRGGSISDVISTFEDYSRGNRTIMKEMLNTFTQTAQQITSISGGVNMGQLSGSIAGISGATGTTGSQLGRVVQGVQGMGKSQNPIIKSLMLNSLRQSNPDASFFDVQAMMENPLGNMEATGSVFEKLKSMTGGGELYKQGLFSTFSGSMSRTDINEILKSGGGFTDIASEAEKAGSGGVKDFSAMLPDVIGKIEKSSAKVESMSQDTGKWVVDFMDKAITQIQKGLDSIGGDPEDVQRKSYETQKKAYKDGMEEFYNANPGSRRY